MKIAFVCIDLINNSGGVERSISSLANHYVQKNHEVHILCLDRYIGKPFFPLDPRIHFHQPLLPQRDGHLSYLHKVKSRLEEQFRKKLKGALPHSHFVAIRQKLHLCRKLHEYYRLEIEAIQHFLTLVSPNISMLHKCYLPFLFVINELRQNQVPPNCGRILSFLHEPIVEFQLFNEQGLNRYYNLYQLLDGSDIIGVNLPEHVFHLPAALQSKVEILTLGADCAPLATLNSMERQKQILFVGRLHPRKGLDLLLYAFRRAKKHAPNLLQGWCLKIVGQAQDRAYTRYLHKLAGVEEDVQFCGQVSEAERKKRYCESAFFVLPSLYEGLGLVLAEAMAFGLPCVGFSDIPGVNTQIRHRQNGLLINDCDRIAGLEAAITELTASSELRQQLGDSALQDCQYYSSAAFFKRWEALL